MSDREQLYRAWWYKKQLAEFMMRFFASCAPQPPELAEHHDLCMCVDCLGSTCTKENHAEDTRATQAERIEDECDDCFECVGEWYDIHGGEPESGVDPLAVRPTG